MKKYHPIWCYDKEGWWHIFRFYHLLFSTSLRNELPSLHYHTFWLPTQFIFREELTCVRWPRENYYKYEQHGKKGSTLACMWQISSLGKYSWHLSFQFSNLYRGFVVLFRSITSTQMQLVAESYLSQSLCNIYQSRSDSVLSWGLIGISFHLMWDKLVEMDIVTLLLLKGTCRI